MTSFLQFQQQARERFDEKAVKRLLRYLKPTTKKKCWNWKGNIGVNGYGVFFYHGKSYKAHQVSYRIFIGEVGNGLVLDHLCRNTKCVNPSHLEAVTQKENILRGTGAPSKNAAKTKCKHGHRLTEENTYHTPSNPTWRECKKCKKIRSDEQYVRRKQKKLSAFKRLRGN